MNQAASRPPTTLAALLAALAALVLAALLVPWSRSDHATTSAGADTVTASGIPGGPHDPDGVGPIATDPNFRVAFIGDTGNGTNFQAVLNLIKSEGADLTLIQGDFDYADDPDGYFATIDSILGPSYPLLGAVGNHDIASWPEGCSDPDGCYAAFFKQHMAAAGIEPDSPNLNDDMYSTDYGGLGMVFTGQTTANAGDCPANANGYACFIRGQLQTDRHIWRVCGWHKNQAAMQLGNKGDEAGWAVYNTCVEMGGMIFTGHEHDYSRTKTLTNPQTQAVDLVQHPLVSGVPSNPNALRVMPGASFVVVSGLGGREMRPQNRCLPAAYPYGCNKEWASVYTTNQTGGASSYGALFIDFYVDGDPYKARGYFKTTTGAVIDSFEIRADFQDADADGIQDALDNCTRWSNPTQALPDWRIPAGDADCDGWPDAATVGTQASELAIGTNPNLHCGVDAWPVDYNNDSRANVSDFLHFNVHLWSKTGDANFSPRYDLNPNGIINVSDLLHFNQFMNKPCT